MNEPKRPRGIIDEASTVVEARTGSPPVPRHGPSSQAQTEGVADATAPSMVAEAVRTREAAKARAQPQSAAEIRQRATELLIAIDVPTSAGRALDQTQSDGVARAAREKSAPRIGEYALIARFPSSETADVYLGYKVSNFGFIRRAVVKFTDRYRFDYESIRQKLLDEARAISFVEHPNIVTILDLAEDEFGTYVALEYVAGTDLRRLLVGLGARQERMPIEHAAYVISEVLRGLHHVHEALGPERRPLRIIHRDVNPSNVLISEDGHVKLTDFGAVHMDGRFQDATAPGTVKGKVRYLAPEYIVSQTCTHQVDLYGVGVMLFELLTGVPCFLADDETSVMYKIVTEGLPLASLEERGVPPQLQAIVEKASQRDPAERYATALEMCVALEDWLSSAGMFVSPTKLAEYLQAHGLLA